MDCVPSNAEDLGEMTFSVNKLGALTTTDFNIDWPRKGLNSCNKNGMETFLYMGIC